MENLYMDLPEKDLIEPILPLLKKGIYQFTDDGRLEAEMRMPSETPWVHVRQDPQKNCSLWHHVWFDYYGFIPSYCQKCWKVVVRPRTLTELFKVLEVLQELDLPSKCGIERRYSVPALYGAYFYNESVEAGQECVDKVDKAVSEKLGHPLPILLKRGCTEFEEKFKDSSKWRVTKEQQHLEARLERLFANKGRVSEQSDEMKIHIMANWLKFAYAQGDPTVHEYLSEPLYNPYRIYYSNEKDGNANET